MSEVEWKHRIVDYIRRNRVSSTQLADCLNKSGSIPNVKAVCRGHFCVGTVRWVYAYEESNWPVHEQVQDINEGDVVLVDAFDCKGRGIFGDIVCKYILLYRLARAVVVRGNLRDAHRLVKENWPIWCEGFNPVGCFNRKPSAPLDENVVAEGKERYEGTVAVCDDTGVVIVPRDRFNEAFCRELEFIEEQEDIWYDCIDRKKWTTFETVCLKRYLEEDI